MSGTNINFARVKDIESAANRSKTKLTELSNSIGTLASLATTDKSSIVSAINEVVNVSSFAGIDCGEITV